MARHPKTVGRVLEKTPVPYSHMSDDDAALFRGREDLRADERARVGHHREEARGTLLTPPVRTGKSWSHPVRPPYQSLN